jgi:hypothetical protein
MSNKIKLKIDRGTQKLIDAETSGVLCAFVGREYGNGRSDTSATVLGNLSERELLKLLVGCTHAYIRELIKEGKNFDEIISMLAKAHSVAISAVLNEVLEPNNTEEQNTN